MGMVEQFTERMMNEKGKFDRSAIVSIWSSIVCTSAYSTYIMCIIVLSQGASPAAAVYSVWWEEAHSCLMWCCMGISNRHSDDADQVLVLVDGQARPTGKHTIDSCGEFSLCPLTDVGEYHSHGDTRTEGRRLGRPLLYNRGPLRDAPVFGDSWENVGSGRRRRRRDAGQGAELHATVALKAE